MATESQNGFTLIELIVVMVLLGILAAFVVPRYADLSKQSRISVVNELYGSIVVAAEMVRSLALARGFITSMSNADLGDGLVVSINNVSYPIADTIYGIGAATVDASGFTITNVSGGIRYDIAIGNPSCSVFYMITGNSSPNISSVTSGC